MVNKIYLLLFLLFSSSAFALLDLKEDSQKPLTEATARLHKEVLALPEVHFLNEQQQLTVDRLLSRVLEEQVKQIDSFKASLLFYKKNKKEIDAWPKVEMDYYSAIRLSHDKQKLLALSSAQVKELVTGFGPDGVTHGNDHKVWRCVGGACG